MRAAVTSEGSIPHSTCPPSDVRKKSEHPWNVYIRAGCVLDIRWTSGFGFKMDVDKMLNFFFSHQLVFFLFPTSIAHCHVDRSYRRYQDMQIQLKINK